MIPASLLSIFNSIGHLTQDALDDIGDKLQHKLVEKKQFLLKEGEISRYIYFIENGMARSFYHDADKEVTSWFMRETDIIISVKSFFLQIPAEESIQTLEDMSIFFVSFHDLLDLYHKHEDFHHIGRRLTEFYYIRSEDRLTNLRKRDAFDRYKYLVENHPEIVNRVSSRIISSYLGINEETLSRLRAKKLT